MKKFTWVVALLAALLLTRDLWAFKAAGFANPYGVVVDPATHFIYVSNVNGSPNAQDDNGFISRLKGDGTIDRMRFIDGSAPEITLHSPKGMAIVGKTLYVADIDVMRTFNLEGGKPLAPVDFGKNGVQHLYGLAAGPDGALYAADGPGNAIYRIDTAAGKATLFVAAGTLGQPHSLVWHRSLELFLVAGWSSGRLTAYDRSGKQQYMPGVFLSTLEGIAVDGGGNIYLASTALRAVYRLTANFVIYGFELDLAAPAGLVYDPAQGAIVIATFDGNKVVSYPVPSAPSP